MTKDEAAALYIMDEHKIRPDKDEYMTSTEVKEALLDFKSGWTQGQEEIRRTWEEDFERQPGRLPRRDIHGCFIPSAIFLAKAKQEWLKEMRRQAREKSFNTVVQTKECVWEPCDIIKLSDLEAILELSK